MSPPGVRGAGSVHPHGRVMWKLRRGPTHAEIRHLLMRQNGRPAPNDGDHRIECADRTLKTSNSRNERTAVPLCLTGEARPIAADGVRLDVPWRKVHLLQLAAGEHRGLIVV